MPRREYDEDLFKSSTMTFGEHLEELRGCLFRSLVGLVAGFVVGLFVGNQVVQFIKLPLKNALEDYQEDKSLRDAEKKLEELQNQGMALPANPAELKHLVKKEKLIPEQVYVQPEEMLPALKARFPEQLKDFPLPEKTPKESAESSGASSRPIEVNREELLPVFIWRPVHIPITSLNAQEPFIIFMKASLLVGALLASPWIFYQIWSFVAAGLYPHEKYYVHMFLPISLGLFLGGAALAFFAVFPPVLDFLFSFNRWLGIEPDPRISEWLSFVLFLPLGFGVAFQLPLVMLFLERIGVFTVETYLGSWRISMLVIFVIAMVLTPADPYSMFLMALPLVVLYLTGVAMCHFMPRRKSPFDE